ncbi:MAG: response regulator [Woeseiaceae bacterium]|nr:response regulator [Woeseiaceae bacterium]
MTESTAGQKTLLLVEDDKLVQNVAIRVLERAGYAVEHASSLREAKGRLADGFVPDLLITDVMLPDGNGRELADAVAEAAPNAPVLFISGYPDDVISEFGLDGSRITFLQKPFTPAQLRETVADLLESVG